MLKKIVLESIETVGEVVYYDEHFLKFPIFYLVFRN